MKKKEVEDVIGGKDAWENVDKADGEFLRVSFWCAIFLGRAGGEERNRLLGGKSKKESDGAKGNGACGRLTSSALHQRSSSITALPPFYCQPNPPLILIKHRLPPPPLSLPC